MTVQAENHWDKVENGVTGETANGQCNHHTYCSGVLIQKKLDLEIFPKLEKL